MTIMNPSTFALYLIFMFIGAIVFVYTGYRLIKFIAVVTDWIKRDNEVVSSYIIRRVVPIAIMVGIMAMGGIVFIQLYKDMDEDVNPSDVVATEEVYDNRDRSDYTFYLDGQRVDQACYDYHLYEYSIDDVHMVIYARSN